MLTISYRNCVLITIGLLLYAFCRTTGVLVWQFDDIALFLFAIAYAYELSTINKDYLTLKKCDTTFGDCCYLTYAYHMQSISNLIDKIYVKVDGFQGWYILDSYACFGYELGKGKLLDYHEYENFILHNRTIKELRETISASTKNKDIINYIGAREDNLLTIRVTACMFIFIFGLLYGCLRFGQEKYISMDGMYCADKENIFDDHYKTDYYEDNNYYYDNSYNDSDTITSDTTTYEESEDYKY